MAKFVNVLTRDGKKSVAERIIYGALDQIKKKSGKDPVETFTLAVNNVKPMVEVKSRRVGGANLPECPLKCGRCVARRWRCAGCVTRPAAVAKSPWASVSRTNLRKPRKAPRRRGEKARGSAPHGGSQQGVFPLQVLID